MKPSRRVLGAFLLSALILILVVVVRTRVEQLSPVQRTINVKDDVTAIFETDRTQVWQEGDCVTVHWRVENIRSIVWSGGPTIPKDSAKWCLANQISTPIFTLELNDGNKVSLAPFALYAIRIPLLILMGPLLVVVLWCLGAHHLLSLSVTKLPLSLRAPFSVLDRVEPILVALFIGFNGIVLWNTLYQSTTWQYDAQGHFDNVKSIAQGHLPTRQDSEEFFSPPLPYLLPALVARITDSRDAIVRIGQLQNVLVSLVLSFTLLKIAMRMHPQDAIPRIIALFLLSILPVYYKSFSFMRGEPFVAMFTLLLCDQFLTLIQSSPSMRNKLAIGLYGGLILLSRQWGALVLLAIGLWSTILLVKRSTLRHRLITTGFIAAPIAIVLGSWFYIALITNSGSALAFNRPPDNAPKPTAFFSGLGDGKLFSYPFAPVYDGQAIPIFYTEIWGDYFGFFHMPRPTLAYRMPDDSVGYMAQVNLLAIFPTLVLGSGVVYGLWKCMRYFLVDRLPQNGLVALMTTITTISIGGFLWFLANYPSSDADTAKGTYLLHIFPLLCVIAGEMLLAVKQRWHWLFNIIIVILLIIATHNIMMYFSRINAS
jgi:hypothetical protein